MAISGQKRKYPPYEVITNYILSGHSTREAQKHFGFENLNISNQQIYYSFKKQNILRPRYVEMKVCRFCGKIFTAIKQNQISCTESICQKRYFLSYAKDKYLKGKGDGVVAKGKWYFIARTMSICVRKLNYLKCRNVWDYRIEYIQRVLRFRPESSPGTLKAVESQGINTWVKTLFAVQTIEEVS